MKDKSKDSFRESIGDLLNDLPDEITDLENVTKLPKVKDNAEVSAGLIKAKSKAKRVMNNLLKFYLSEEIIEEHEYIKAKSELDEYALGMLIKQMENSEIAISTLMTSISEGDVSPRMFEVLSDLQRTLLDIIKSQTMYMIAIEENAKKISREIDIYSESSTATKPNKNTIKSRGTKDLMRALQSTIENENIKDVESD